jgi:hypothetical protein
LKEQHGLELRVAQGVSAIAHKLYRERGQARAFFIRLGCARDVTTQDDVVCVADERNANSAFMPVKMHRA